MPRVVARARSDSPYQTAKQLIDDLRARPAQSLKASGTGQGGIWHLGLVGWLLDEGIDPAKVPWVPSQGSAPAMQDLVAGGVDFVTASLPEGRTSSKPDGSARWRTWTRRGLRSTRAHRR